MSKKLFCPFRSTSTQPYSDMIHTTSCDRRLVGPAFSGQCGGKQRVYDGDDSIKGRGKEMKMLWLYVVAEQSTHILT